MEKLVIIGAGSHATCVLANILEENSFEIGGFLDSTRTGSIAGYPILGDDSLLPSLKRKGIKYAFPGAAIGNKADTTIIEKIFEKIIVHGFDIPNLISSRAVVRRDVSMSKGILIQPLAVVDVGVSLGNGVVVNPCVLVGHHCRVDDYVVFAGGAILNANITIGKKTFIGMGAKIFADIGPMCKIAPGTVVMEPVPERQMVFGNPARIMPRIN